MKNTIENIKRMKNAAYNLAQMSDTLCKATLDSLSHALIENIDNILQENKKDLAHMSSEDPRHDRLKLTPERIQSIAQDVQKLVDFPSPLHHILSDKILPNGLRLQKISVPLGVIGVIYESRPNVTVDVFSLCFKSGNACILKGGKEAQHTNEILFKIIQETLILNKMDPHIVYLMPSDRAAIAMLLNAVGDVDVCIPRGSQELINYVRDHSKIPVIETGAGIVHTYFDLSADLEKGKRIIENAKTRRVSVCNALDTLIIHEQRLNALPELTAALAEKEVEIFADAASYNVLSPYYPAALLKKATTEDFGREFLSYKMSIKTVASLDEALTHIKQYSSCHSEAIIAEDPATIESFMNQVDAAVVYMNASTAFTDGGEFGMGSEIGISTQKLHARGPMGLETLTSYKWLVYGNGQVRA